MILGTLLLAAGGITVTIPMNATVRGTEIELGEVATIECADAGQAAAIASVELGYAPAPGYSRLLLRDKIQVAIENKLPNVDVRVVGQRACRVRPEVVQIPEERLLATARAELQRRYGVLDATFELRDPIAAIAIPAGAAEPGLRARLQESELRTGAINVPVEVLVDGATYRTVWTTWEASVWRTVPVLNQVVPAGEVLTLDMFTDERRPFLGSDGMKPLSADRLAGSVAARKLEAGEVVTSRDVHRPTAIQAGSTVFLRVRKGGIEAQVSATALDSGAVGDRIRVRTLDAGQELFASILTREVVAIDLGN